LWITGNNHTQRIASGNPAKVEDEQGLRENPDSLPVAPPERERGRV